MREIENGKSSAGDVPQSPVVIVDCGELQPDDPTLQSQPVPVGEGGDPYEDWPEDEENDVHNPEIALKIAKGVREAANVLFKKGDITGAFTKYQSKQSPRSPYFSRLTVLSSQRPLATWTCTFPSRQTHQRN